MLAAGSFLEDRRHGYAVDAVLCCRVKADGGHGGKGGNVLVQADARCCIHRVFLLPTYLYNSDQNLQTVDGRAFVFLADDMQLSRRTLRLPVRTKAIGGRGGTGSSHMTQGAAGQDVVIKVCGRCWVEQLPRRTGMPAQNSSKGLLLSADWYSCPKILMLCRCHQELQFGSWTKSLLECPSSSHSTRHKTTDYATRIRFLT